MIFDDNIMELKIVNTILGVFLLIVAVAGNFIAESLNCQTQKLLTNNMFVKNLIIFMVIYFALDFTSEEGNLIHPKELFIRAFMIWSFFLIFNKMDLIYTAIVFFSLFYILVTKNIIKYYNNKKESKKMVEYLKKSTFYTFVLIIVTMLIGFSLYFKKQYTDHKNNFNFIDFIFGKTKCRSLIV